MSCSRSAEPVVTPEEIACRLDLNHIADAAAHAARALDEFQFAVVHLAPGDMTTYQIIVVAPGVETFGGGMTRDFLVTLGGQLGTTYPWRGHHMHSDYVTTKWVIGDHLWTGVVLTEFLNALAPFLDEAPVAS